MKKCTQNEHSEEKQWKDNYELQITATLKRAIIYALLAVIVIQLLFCPEWTVKIPSALGASDFLTLVGTILAGYITLVGVIKTIENSDRKSNQDIIKRVKPVLHLLSLKYDYTKPILPDHVHDTAFYRIEKIVYDYCSEADQFTPKSEFDAKTIELLSKPSIEKKYFCMSVDLENIGVGSASNIQILLTDNKDSFDTSNQYVNLSPLNPSDKIPIYIFSAEASNILGKKFYFNMVYYDIYGNRYSTQFEFTVEKPEHSPLSRIFNLDRGKTYFTPQERLGNINCLSIIESNK